MGPEGGSAKSAEGSIRQYKRHKSNGCGKLNHFKAVCRSMQRQRQGQRSSQRSEAVQKVQQDETPYTWEHDLVKLDTEILIAYNLPSLPN